MRRQGHAISSQDPTGRLFRAAATPHKTSPTQCTVL